MVRLAALLVSVALCQWPEAFAAAPLVHHELQVELHPDQGLIHVVDTLHLPPELAQDNLCLSLHPGLRPKTDDPKVMLRPENRRTDPGGLDRFCLDLPPDRRQVTLSYGGPIRYPRLPVDAAAPVSSLGVYLGDASHWYPRFGDEQITLRLETRLPEGWRSVSQGRRRQQSPRAGFAEVWEETRPQETIWLIAAPFHEYTGADQPALSMAFLRQPDPELAWRYLDVTAYYLDFYSRLLGPYAYDKFALVENFWETGYGMPSFTLLGPRVLRLPFILHTSYPHEILHNWWGNGVYQDPSSGNWTEGLTAYLADHLSSEREGRGAEHRRNSLQRYTDYAHQARDFPLGRFQARHDPASQAVGYDKGLMVFHMLRRRLKDKLFIQGLRRFYAEQLSRRAGFAELEAAFEAVSGLTLDNWFKQWLQRSGAPALSIEGVTARPEGDSWRLSGRLRQTQPGPAYVLEVPLAVQIDGQDPPWQATVTMDTAVLDLDLALPARPWRLRIDPWFELMRRLDRGEIPPALSQLLGAERLLLVLPTSAPPPARDAYQRFADAWSAGRTVESVLDTELDSLPADRSVWLLGWENRHLPRLAETLAPRGVAFDAARVRLEGQSYSREGYAVMLVTRPEPRSEHALAWMGAPPGALPALGRKLPHYGRYSFLVFTGEEAGNLAKGQWPVDASPLNVEVAHDDKAVAPGQWVEPSPTPPLAP